MGKRTGIIYMLIGAAMILASLLLLIGNRREDARAGRASESLLPEVRAAAARHIAEEGPGPYAETQPAAEKEETPEMTVTEIDGYGYIGYLSVPDLGLELPIMADWDYDRLKIAPCRQFGSVYTDDLVIVGHNYRKHFRRLSDLEAGSPIIFTDMNGCAHCYSVAEVAVIQPTDVDYVRNSPFDLVLYTCTYGGKSRITVGCEKKE